MMVNESRILPGQQLGFLSRLRKDIYINRYFYIMVLPVLAHYILFQYVPMYGAMIAFKEFSPALGILDSPWVGFRHFTNFFEGYYFWRVVRNTIWISLNLLVFGFPAPIILALLINELKNKVFTRTVQTITYMPHFISLVVICGMIRDFTMDSGVINHIFAIFGGERVTMLNRPGMFVPLYIISDIWQGIGFGSIIYLSALMGIDPQLYEAATIDGAGRLKQTWHITLPGIAPVVAMLLILRLGGIMSVGFEKIILLYNPGIYETADVISSYVYRQGLQEFNFSFSAAVGLFNSIINFILLITANFLSKRMNQASFW